QTNSGPERTGTLTIAGQTFTVIQNAGSGCTYSIAPLSATFGAVNGNGNIAVTAPDGCNWTAVSNAPSFVTITGGANGNGSGTANYSITANTTSPPLPATITVAQHTFPIVQGTSNTSLRTIVLNSPLPRILEPIIIDGSTQPGFAGTPIIEINGSNLAAQGG